MMCMDGSTTNCSECPTMSGCDTSTCETAMCPGYDPNRVCQCNSDCDTYGDCCDDAYACIQDPCHCPEEMGWNSIMQMCMEGSMTTCAECPGMDECYDDSMDDGVLCPGHSIEDFCDCDGDCFEQPALCSCAEAQACCNTEPMTTDEGTTAPAAGILCPDMPITDYCDCESDCLENPSFCACETAQACCADYAGRCVGEISSMDSRCARLTNEEDCEAEGVNAFSDGICDWIPSETQSSEAPTMQMVCNVVPKCENCKCNDETMYSDSLRGFDSEYDCYDYFETQFKSGEYTFMSMRSSGCLPHAACPDDEIVRDTQQPWMLYEVICSEQPILMG